MAEPVSARASTPASASASVRTPPPATALQLLRHAVATLACVTCSRAPSSHRSPPA